jgi:hypothetical protein
MLSAQSEIGLPERSERTMRNNWPRTARLAALLAVLTVDSVFVGCGSTIGGSGTTHLAVTVSVSPTSASVTAGAEQQFIATVENASNTAVIWQVSGITGGNAAVLFGSLHCPGERSQSRHDHNNRRITGGLDEISFDHDNHFGSGNRQPVTAYAVGKCWRANAIHRHG